MKKCGLTTLAAAFMQSIEGIYGQQVVQQRDLLNNLLRYLPKMQPRSAFGNLQRLLKFAKNEKLCHFESAYYLLAN